VGDLVVLYSDGLVEDRRTHLDDRLAMLAEVARSAPDLSPDYFADWLLSEMSAGTADDVALLVVRVED
jgi:serine phosphatase RsbU (regulator of sigma subunit)